MPKSSVKKTDIDKYLQKPVSAKEKSGQENYMELVFAFLRDLRDGQMLGAIDYAAVYVQRLGIILFNAFMHNSSHSPPPGYGKAKKEEREHPLYYYRSQGNHPHRIKHDKLVKDSLSEHYYAGKISYLPRNQPFEKMAEITKDGNLLRKVLGKLDEFGFLEGAAEEEKLKNYRSTFIAHSGARLNNYAIYASSIDNIDHSFETLEAALRNSLPKQFNVKYKKRVSTASYLQLPNLIKISHQRIVELKNRIKHTAYFQNLQISVLKQRKDAAKYIITKCKENTTMRLTSIGSTLCIDLYPKEHYSHLSDAKRATENYSQGVTGTIMGFFIAILNHNAQKAGLDICAIRRQSFGFLKISLTDAGSMRIRMSLGLEPSSYNDVVVNSLNDLDNLLKTYNFSKPSNTLVKPYFATAERSKGNNKNNATEDTGNFMRTRMRSVENEQNASMIALSHITAAEGITDSVKLKNAFKSYLDEFILNDRKPIDLASKKFTVTNIAPATGASTTFMPDILSNAVIYALDLIAKQDHRKIKLYLRMYFLAIEKIHNDCEKALALLHDKAHNEAYLYAKANLLLENIMEYLIVVDNIILINQQKNDNHRDPLKELTDCEVNYICSMLGIESQHVGLYFTDSGQQAITAAIMAAEHQTFWQQGKKKYISDNSIYIESDAYYETGKFLDDIDCSQTHYKANARILFIDETRFSAGEALYDFKPFTSLAAVIVDITHDPSLSNHILKTAIGNLRGEGKWVMLVSSAIKHEQLGQDKYQSGKIFTLAPKGGGVLREDIIKDLTDISKTAMNQPIASYLQMVNHILQTKVQAASAPLMTPAPKLGAGA